MGRGAHRPAGAAGSAWRQALANWRKNWRQAGATMTWDERVGVALGLLAVSIAFAVSACGIGGPFPDGHYASTSVIGTAAYNSYRWNTLLPIETYLDHAPNASLYYMHHPLGMFWVVDVLGKVFGLHDWVLRLPPLFYVTVTTALLYKLGRALWGALPGGLCALAYVALPITLGYANYHDLEQPVIFGVVLASWGYLRYVRTWRERYAVASVLGFAFALNNDWAAYLWGAPFLAGLFVYGFLLSEPRRGALEMKRFGRYWAFMCVAVAFSVVVELAVLDASNRIADVLQSYMVRSAGAGAPLKAVLAARRYRIELMFTTPAIALGKLALPIIVARAVVKRSHFELLPLPIFICALVQYVAFKEGADIHIFWPHYFAPYFALAVGALAATARELCVWSGAQVKGGAASGRAVRAAPWVALAVLGLPLLFILKDGLSLLRLARDGRALRRGEPRHRSRQGGGAALVPGPLPDVGRRRLPRRHPRRLGAAVGAAAPAVIGEPTDPRGRHAGHARLHHGHARGVAGRAARGGRALPRPRGRPPLDLRSGRASSAPGRIRAR